MQKLQEPKFQKERHLMFCNDALQGLPGQYAPTDAHRMTFVYFCVSGMDMLGMDKTIPKKKVIEWVYEQQILPSEGKVHPMERGHLAMTYTDDLKRVNKKGIIDAMKKLQLKDGSFVPAIGDLQADMRFVYCACCIAAMLGDWSGINVDAAVEFVKNSINWQGGIGMGPMQESHGGTTYCAVAALQLMNRLDAITPAQRSRMVKWCLQRQGSGFIGRPNKPPDTCYAFWIGSTLKILGVYDMSFPKGNRLFSLSCQNPLSGSPEKGIPRGGFGKHPSKKNRFIPPDLLHTYMSICGLSYMGMDNLPEVIPSLGFRAVHAKNLKLFSK